MDPAKQTILREVNILHRDASTEPGVTEERLHTSMRKTDHRRAKLARKRNYEQSRVQPSAL